MNTYKSKTLQEIHSLFLQENDGKINNIDLYRRSLLGDAVTDIKKIIYCLDCDFFDKKRSFPQDIFDIVENCKPGPNRPLVFDDANWNKNITLIDNFFKSINK